jgi:NADH/NAD ratio-sensing transcriptional regulator Rex
LSSIGHALREGVKDFAILTGTNKEAAKIVPNLDKAGIKSVVKIRNRNLP